MIETKETLKIRKAPKFLPFLLTGAVVGVILAFILNGFSNGEASILGYLIGWLAPLGAAAGIIVALVADWIFSRSAKEVQATKLRK